MSNPLFLDPAALETLCHRHHIRRLSLVGSTLNGTDRPDSDVDLLVEISALVSLLPRMLSQDGYV